MTTQPPDTVLVVDVGSSSLRASLFDGHGNCARHVARPMPAHGRAACGEIAAADLWATVIGAIAALDTAPGRIGCIGITAALGMVLAAEDGAALSDVVTWQDRRAETEAAAVVQRAGGMAHLCSITGRRAAPELLAPLLLWFRAHRPVQFGAAAGAPSLKDWLVQRLCGARCTDPTSASYTMLFDVRAGGWSAELADAFDMPGRFLPPVRGAADIAGGLAADVARHCGLRAGTPVIVGGPDGTVAGIGGGMTRPGVAIDVMGTTDVVFAQSRQPRADPQQQLVLNRFPVGEAWTIGGPLAATGGAVAWLLGVLGGRRDALAEAARAVPPGAGGLAFLPTLAGSRAPRWDPAERGMLHGLSFEHGAPHLFRALLEGCAAEVAEVFDALVASGVAIAELRGVGGGTASELWLQIRASMLERPIAIPRVAEASSLGTAMLGAVAVGMHADLAAAAAGMIQCTREVAPVPEWVEPYRALRRRNRGLRCATPIRPRLTFGASRG